MQPPTEVGGGFETSTGTLSLAQLIGVENTQDAECFGELFKALVKLGTQQAEGSFSFALQKHKVATTQGHSNVRRSLAGPSFWLSGNSVINE